MTVYAGVLPSGADLFAGDYLTSPDGLYYAEIDATGAVSGTPGLVIVAPGSNPTIAPAQSCISCYYPVTTTPTSNLGGFFAQLGTDGNLVVYTSASGKNQGTTVPVSSTMTAQNPANPPYYAAIQDTPGNHNDGGSFIIYQGTSPDKSNPLTIYNQNIVGSVKSISLSGGASGTGITYDFADAKVDKVVNVASDVVTATNYTSQTQQYNMNLTLAYVKSSSFSFAVSNSTSVSIGSSVMVGVPGIGGSTISFSATSSTSITKGQTSTTSTSTSFQAGARPDVPPGYTYEGYITGEDVTFDVPFTWDGIATYAGGAQAAVEGTGVYHGEDTGLFQVLVYCTYAPPGSAPCPSIPIIDESVADLPEPGTLMLLPLALLATAALRRLRGRRLLYGFACAD